MISMVMAKKQKKSLLTRIGALGLTMAAVVLLAACQPTGAPAAAQAPAADTQGSGGNNGQRSNFQMTPASELPTTTPVARGMVTKIDGNTLTVQEGGLNFGQGNGGTPRPRPTSDGTPRPRPTQAPAQTIQIIVNGDTQYYQDVTFANLNNGQPPSGAIQQKVEKGSLAALTGNERVTVWGDQNGDQITAKVIVYSQFRGGAQGQQPQQP